MNQQQTHDARIRVETHVESALSEWQKWFETETRERGSNVEPLTKLNEHLKECLLDLARIRPQ